MLSRLGTVLKLEEQVKHRLARLRGSKEGGCYPGRGAALAPAAHRQPRGGSGGPGRRRHLPSGRTALSGQSPGRTAPLRPPPSAARAAGEAEPGHRCEFCLPRARTAPPRASLAAHRRPLRWGWNSPIPGGFSPEHGPCVCAVTAGSHRGHPCGDPPRSGPRGRTDPARSGPAAVTPRPAAAAPLTCSPGCRRSS